MNPTGTTSANLELVEKHLHDTCEQSKKFFQEEGGETAVECAIELNVIRQCQELLKDRVILEACNNAEENARLHIVGMKYYLNDKPNVENEHFVSMLYHYPKNEKFEEAYEVYLKEVGHHNQKKLRDAMKRGLLD